MSAKFIKLTIASVNRKDWTAESYHPIYFNVDHIVSIGAAPDDPVTQLCLCNDPMPPPENWEPAWVMETPEQILTLINGARS